MRKFLLAAMAVVMVMGISRTATAAEVLTANRLLKMCESPVGEGLVNCQAYITGFLQGVGIANVIREIGMQICFPREMQGDQLLKMFVKSANENPEALHFEANQFLWLKTAKPFVWPTAAGSCSE